jgi:putative Mn2+ efflux pump MntP
MADSQPDGDDRSVTDQLRWVLYEQYDDTTVDQLRNALVLIGIATSFLAFVAATTAIVSSVDFLWTAVALGVLGFLTLAFTWMMALGEFQSLFRTDST